MRPAPAPTRTTHGEPNHGNSLLEACRALPAHRHDDGCRDGATERFALAPAHAHVNLLGWVTLALAAAVFSLWPQTATTRLARAFFWIYNLALPPSMLALSLVLLGESQWVPVLIVGQLAIYVVAVILVVNILVTLRGASTAVARASEGGLPGQGTAAVADTR